MGLIQSTKALKHQSTFGGDFGFVDSRHTRFRVNNLRQCLGGLVEFQGCNVTGSCDPCITSRLVIISFTTHVTGSQHLPVLMTTAMQPLATLGTGCRACMTIESPLAERRFRWKAGAAPIQNEEKEREALLFSTSSPATRRNATRVS